MSEHAITVHEYGGPDVLRYEEVEVPDLGPGEVRIRHTSIGVNLRDVYDRTGLYPLPLPSVLGVEAAGVVEKVGPGVAGFREGDRVAYCSEPYGAYATARLYPADQLVKLPDGISEEDAAALLLKGLTVWFLLRRVREVRAGETILFHAVAGGVGLIACQWARHLGVRLIGTAGTGEKAEAARAHGAAEVILYRREDVPARVRELTDGAGVPVVYDSVGMDTWVPSLDSLQPRGLMVSFGNASGPVTGVSLLDLASRGSLYATRPRLVDYTATREDLQAGAKELFDLVLEGAITAVVGQRYPLAEAAEMHRALEARTTTGSTLLLP
ncbi:MAG: quinone oxidoreductase family protein [Actinomycetota bacterium]